MSPPADPTPLYAALESQIAAGISGGEFPVGSQLPTEEQLIQRFSSVGPPCEKPSKTCQNRGLMKLGVGRVPSSRSRKSLST